MGRGQGVLVKGQAATELTLICVAVVGSLIFMAIYLQRGAQGGVKSGADSLGTQYSSDRMWDSVSVSATAEDAASIAITKTVGGATATATSGVATNVQSNSQSQSGYAQTLP